MTIEEPDRSTAEAGLPMLLPTRLIRIAGVAHGVLEEIHAAPLDELGRLRALGLLRSCVAELGQCLEPEFRTELHDLLVDLDGAGTSDATLRVAQATVVGWVDGLLRGMQANWSAELITNLRPGNGRSRLGSGDPREALAGR